MLISLFHRLAVGALALGLLLDLLPQPWRIDALRLLVGYVTFRWLAQIVAQIAWPRAMARRKQLRVRSVGQGHYLVQGSLGSVVGALVFTVAARFTEFTAFWTIAACCVLSGGVISWFQGRAILRDPNRAPVLSDLTPEDLDRAAARTSRVLPFLVVLLLAWAASWWPLAA